MISGHPWSRKVLWGRRSPSSQWEVSIGKTCSSFWINTGSVLRIQRPMCPPTWKICKEKIHFGPYLWSTGGPVVSQKDWGESLSLWKKQKQKQKQKKKKKSQSQPQLTLSRMALLDRHLPRTLLDPVSDRNDYSPDMWEPDL